MTNSVDIRSARFFPYRPALHGIFSERFYSRMQKLTGLGGSLRELEAFVEAELSWAVYGSTINPKQRRTYRAAWSLFRDLVRIGWEFRWHSGTIEIKPRVTEKVAHNLQDKDRIKDGVRRAMAGGRAEKIIDAKEFIERMETPPSAGIARVPISALVANGLELASDLKRIASANGDEKVALLRRTIRPYLQLVTDNERCSETGHRLSDIWRYFRFTWASPAENTPGRTMLYLVRDASRPFHPVMGIASLENAPLRVACREDYLGWTPQAFEDWLLEEPTKDTLKQKYGQLLTNIAQALSEIDLQNLCSPSECENPSPNLLKKLAGIVARSATERDAALAAWRSRPDAGIEGENEEYGLKSTFGNISTAAEEHLFRRKRAERVGRLLSARLSLQDLLNSSDFEAKWRSFVTTEAGQSAILTALIAEKNRHVGTSMLELNVCGAIPPYNAILGGKLVALAMLSPQIIDDYRHRYGNRPSDIASRMKGAPIVRPADLVYIGTTSLYRVGSSQYNRLKLPANFLRANAPEVRWRELGETGGYGTLHISRTTLRSLEEAVGDHGVNHVFGEGASPKLRTIRLALDELFEPGQRAVTDEIVKHAMHRLVYGVWLAVNGREYFRGEAKRPRYYFADSQDPQEGSQRIFDYWRSRWLSSRLNNTEAIERIAAFDFESLRVSRDLTDDGTPNFAPICEVRYMDGVFGDGSETWRDFVRNLYRGGSAYADSTDSALLRDLHVPTPLDDAIMESVSAGKSVILTGNPGDGKTHLLRVLEDRLNQLPICPVVELDASAEPDTNIQSRWADAVSQGKPYCAAINEAVLFNLAADYPAFAPLQEAKRQVIDAIIYDEDHKLEASIIVFDLNHRNILSGPIINAVIEKLTDPKLIGRCLQCPGEGCDLVQNIRLLRTTRVQERLQVLFDRASRQGYHATLHEILSFVSYLMFGGRSCDQLLRESADPKMSFAQLPYRGKGPLFDFFRRNLDPSLQSHPIWDETLITGETNIEDWLEEWRSDIPSIDPNNLTRFRDRKRAFYFFHQCGDQALTISESDEAAFGGLLEASSRDALKNVILRINTLFSVASERDELRVWESHRYNQAPRRVLYSTSARKRREFEIVWPSLRSTMAQGFDLARDHVLLRLVGTPQVKLRVDFNLFKLFGQSQRGVPVISLEGNTMWRLWQFMEQLSLPIASAQRDEVFIVLLDPTTSERLTVEVDAIARKYMNIR